MASNTSMESSGNYLSFNDVLPPEIIKEKAKELLNETPELREECLQQLRQLIKDNDVDCTNNDDFLMVCLRYRKYNVQRSFEFLQSMIKELAEVANCVLDLQPSVLKNLIRRTSLGVLPQRDSMGRLILLRRIGLWSTDICTFEEFHTAVGVLFHYLIQDQLTQITGVIMIFDFLEGSASEFLSFLPYLNVWSKLLFKAFPLKCVKIHLLDLPRPVTWAFQAMKLVLPEKMRSKIMFHEKEKRTLLDHISPDILPPEYGGTNDPLTCDQFAEVMENHLGKFKEQLQCLDENESKTQGEGEISGKSKENLESFDEEESTDL